MLPMISSSDFPALSRILWSAGWISMLLMFNLTADKRGPRLSCKSVAIDDYGDQHRKNYGNIYDLRLHGTNQKACPGQFSISKL